MQKNPSIISSDLRCLKASLNYFLTLEFNNTNKIKSAKAKCGCYNKDEDINPNREVINIVPGYIYSFKFYDLNRKRMIDARNVRVTGISNIAHDPNDAIIEAVYTECTTVTGRNNSKYGNRITIPLSNLRHVSYNNFENFKDHNDKEKTWRNIIMILGITVSELRFIILKLKFFDDIASESYKEVTLKTDNRYRFTYYDYKEGVLKELVGSLKGISRTEAVATPKDTFVRETQEVIGEAEKIYETSNTKEFYDADELCHDYRLAIIPDEIDHDMPGAAEFIYISSLRYCDELVELIEPEEPYDDGWQYHHHCRPSNHHHPDHDNHHRPDYDNHHCHHYKKDDTDEELPDFLQSIHREEFDNDING